MSQYLLHLVKDSDLNRWKRLFHNAQYPLYTKSLHYAHIQKLNGRKVETYLLERDGTDLVGAHFSLKPALGGIFKTADLVSGIVIHKEATKDDLIVLLDYFLQWAKKHGAAVARINPWIPASIGQNSAIASKCVQEALLQKGFGIGAKPVHTYWVDLTKPEADILAAMKSQTRRKIRKATKVGFEVEHITTPKRNKIDLFWKAYQRLGQEKDFNTLSYERFFAEVEALLKTGAVLFVFKYKGVVINIALATSFGITSYYHGALNPDYKDLEGCPSPGHYVQWHMMTYMKNAGYALYDMAFCPGPEPYKEHPQYNMWRFKHSFGGQHVEFMPQYVKKTNVLLGTLFMLIKRKV